MDRKSGRRWAVATFATLLFGHASQADPLHKVGAEGAYRHEGSGWIFARQIGEFQRVGAPYTLDGNDDVGAEYTAVASGSRRTALIDIYYADSAASGSTFAGADAAMRSAQAADAPAQSKVSFHVAAQSQLQGVKVTYRASVDADSEHASLYFIQTPAWIVTIRTRAPAADDASGASLDDFVRTLPWETLGSDPGDLHSAGS